MHTDKKIFLFRNMSPVLVSGGLGMDWTAAETLQGEAPQTTEPLSALLRNRELNTR